MAARKKFPFMPTLTKKQVSMLVKGRAQKKRGRPPGSTNKSPLAKRLDALIQKESKRVGRPQVLSQALAAREEMQRIAKINPRAHGKQMMKQLENKIPLPILERRLAKLTQVVQNRHAWIARFGGK